MSLGTRIRERRKSLGLSQAQLEQKSGISQQMLSKLERGAAFGTTEIAALARALNVCVQWLESGEEPMIPPTLEAISPDEREWLEAYRTMDAEERNAYRLLLRSRRKERIIVIEQPQIPANNLSDDSRRIA